MGALKGVTMSVVVGGGGGGGGGGCIAFITFMAKTIKFTHQKLPSSLGHHVFTCWKTKEAALFIPTSLSYSFSRWVRRLAVSS